MQATETPRALPTRHRCAPWRSSSPWAAPGPYQSSMPATAHQWKPSCRSRSRPAFASRAAPSRMSSAASTAVCFWPCRPAALLSALAAVGTPSASAPPASAINPPADRARVRSGQRGEIVRPMGEGKKRKPLRVVARNHHARAPGRHTGDTIVIRDRGCLPQRRAETAAARPYSRRRHNA